MSLNPDKEKIHLRQVYWSDWDRQDPRIERSAMNGEDRSVVVRENLALPNALAVDYEYEDLCWTDAGTQLISESDI